MMQNSNDPYGILQQLRMRRIFQPIPDEGPRRDFNQDSFSGVGEQLFGSSRPPQNVTYEMPQSMTNQNVSQGVPMPGEQAFVPSQSPTQEVSGNQNRPFGELGEPLRASSSQSINDPLSNPEFRNPVVGTRDLYPEFTLRKPEFQSPDPSEMPPPVFRTESRGIPRPEPFVPSHKYADEYRASLDQMPEVNKPGFWRRLAAAGYSFGGHDANEVLYAPYNEKMMNWKPKNEGLKDLAAYEQQSNTQARMAQSANANQDIAYRREQRLQEEADLKKNFPNHIMKEVQMPDGTMQWALFDPKDPTKQGIPTGWSTGRFSAYDAAVWNRQTQIAAAEAGVAKNPELQQRAQYNRALQAANSDPEVADMMVFGDPPGTVTMRNPNTWFTEWARKKAEQYGPQWVASAFDRRKLQEKYEKVLKYVYPDDIGDNPFREDPNSRIGDPAPQARPYTGPDMNQPSPQRTAPTGGRAVPPRPPSATLVPNVPPALIPQGGTGPNPGGVPNGGATPPAPRIIKVTPQTPIPPPEQRRVDDIYSFPNGNMARWDGTKLIEVK